MVNQDISETIIEDNMYIVEIIIEPIIPAIVPIIVTPPLVPLGTLFLRLVMSLGVVLVIIPISVIHVSALWVANDANAANNHGDDIINDISFIVVMIGKKSTIKNMVPNKIAGKLFEITWRESLFESLENSNDTECFWFFFHFETKDDDKKKVRRALQRNGEIK